MEEFEDEEILPAQDLVQCHICNRSFFPKVLEKHIKICQKSAAKRRKVFDSSRQRAEGTDIPTLKPLKPKSQSSSSSVKAEPPKKPNNWRRKHEDFIAAIRAARAVSQGMKDGDPLPPPPPPSYDPDYIQCPYCQRRFNENAADRHIKFCQEQAARMVTGPRQKSRNRQLEHSLGKPRVTSSGYGSVRNASGTGVNKKKVDSCISRNELDGSNDIGNGGVKSKFCHECGAKYPVESAKFCCECGVRRMCI
ncbi:hypothetical protein WMY93_029737 [Mugilogobius chulae]|uniref:Zinc finger C2HC domain-containing protein 1A n=1 Tax=Mugilogobius chulae TaxID=88201 RepID=A0AAW0MKP2_9GOBI